MLYSSTLNITDNLSLCNYCQHSSAAHCTLSVHSICSTVTHSKLQSNCFTLINVSRVQLHPVHHLYTQYALQLHTQHYSQSVSLKLMSVQFSCTLYTICTLNMLYSNTLKITVTLSLSNYCQYSSSAQTHYLYTQYAVQ